MNAQIKILACVQLVNLLFTGTFSVAAENPELVTNSELSRAIAGSHRSQEHRARDTFRHPQQTLEFFGLTASMTVVEIWPGAKGWYTEILALTLKDHGKLYAAHFSPDSEVAFFTSSLVRFREKIAENPDVYAKVNLTILQPPLQLDIAPKGTADRVLTFRNLHNWMKSGQADAVFQAMFDALKPGGILGVVEHRGIAEQPQDPKALSGYVTENHVLELAKKAGFEFVGNSEINANPKDTKVHPAGVWTLPPTLRLKDQDVEKYREIGESDRMTLKFRKPEIKTKN